MKRILILTVIMASALSLSVPASAQKAKNGKAKKETVISYVHGEDEIQIRSWDKRLNAAIRKLKQDELDTVWIMDNEKTEPGYLWAAVKCGHLTFRTVRSPTEKSRAAQSAAGKQHAGNLRHQKEKAPP